MKTSNFRTNQLYGLNGISISRYPDRRSGFKGPEFPPLFPSAQLLADYKAEAIDWQGYTTAYLDQLFCLNAEKVWSLLEAIAQNAGAPEPILLCYESGKTLETNPCHRRLVAGWLQQELGLLVPEWSKDDAQT